MAIQSLNLNNSQPLKVNQVSSSGENISNAPKYRMAYVPLSAELYDRYCSSGYCSGRFFNYLI